MGFTEFGLAASALVLGAQLAAAQECSDFTADLRGANSQIRFTVEIADDEAERSKGLMFRESMPQFAGMLFVYPAPHDAAFWMKNTFIPLDMLFLDDTGTVLRIVENAEPLTQTPRIGGPGVQFVLEVNGGMAARLGLAEGAEMRHQAVDQAKAAWKCPG